MYRISGRTPDTLSERPDIRLDIGYIKRPNIWLKIGQGKKGLSTRGKKVNTGIMNEVVHYGIHT